MTIHARVLAAVLFSATLCSIASCGGQVLTSTRLTSATPCVLEIPNEDSNGYTVFWAGRLTINGEYFSVGSEKTDIELEPGTQTIAGDTVYLTDEGKRQVNNDALVDLDRQMQRELGMSPMYNSLKKETVKGSFVIVTNMAPGTKYRLVANPAVSGKTARGPLVIIRQAE